MDLEDAKKVLDSCTRSELRDHAFGDMEVSWILKGVEIAEGYFSGNNASVWVNIEPADHVSFEGDEARELHSCGTLGHIERNDETGPERYTEGVTMPGLTSAGVLKELTSDVVANVDNYFSQYDDA